MKKEDLSQFVKKILIEQRQAISRLAGPNEITNKKFAQLLYSLVKNTNSEGQSSFVIDTGTNKSINLVEKADSVFCHFGIHGNKQFFMESSNSGPTFAKNYRQKFDFNRDFEETFDYLLNNEQFQDAMRQMYDKIGSFRYSAELFPVLTHKMEDSGTTFSVIPYNSANFGEYGAFLLFECEIWSKSVQKWKKIDQKLNIYCQNLLKSDKSFQNEWKILTNDANMSISTQIEVDVGRKLATFMSDGVEFGDLMRKLRQNDIKYELNKVKNSLQNTLKGVANRHPSLLTGQQTPGEGVILYINSVLDNDNEQFLVKATSDWFDNKKKDVWSTRQEVLNLFDEVKNTILTEFLTFNTSHDASIGAKIKEISSSFMNSGQAGSKVRTTFIDYLIPHLITGEIDLDSMKQELEQYITNIEGQLSNIKQEYSSKEYLFDPNSARKTEQTMSWVDSKLTGLKSCIETGSMPIPCLVDILIGHKIDKNITFEIGSEDVKNSRKENVIIYPVRGQVWHIGHYKAVEHAKDLLSDHKADKVLIMTVRGEKTSQDADKNPLSGREQLTLLNELYKGDRKVEVLQTFPNSAYIVDLAMHLKGYNVVGWLTGEDRANQYTQNLYNFSPQQFEQNNGYTPFTRNKRGLPVTRIIKTRRIQSGTHVRKMAKELSFPQWLRVTMPIKLDNDVIYLYNLVYKSIKEGTNYNEDK
jgi:hypothetical protein